MTVGNRNHWQRLGLRLTAAGLALTTLVAAPLRAAQTQVTPTAQPPQLAQSNAVDLTPLRSHLQTQNWQAADQETRRLLQLWVHPNEDVFSTPLASNIPLDLLRTIDQLWVEASGGRFGFSVQQRLWNTITAQYPNDPVKATRAFGDRVGWTRPTDAPENFTAPEWLTEPELTPSLAAPVGHLPWAGIDSERIERMLSDPGCSICTVDALYLQGDRFNRYLPGLFAQVNQAIAAAPVGTQSWDFLRLTREINLHSLYPNSTCPIREVSSAIRPDSQVVAIGSYSYERSCPTPGESALALWNAQRGNRIITLHQGPALEAFSQGSPPQEPPTEGNRIVGDVANAIAFTPDGRLVAAGLSNGSIRLWTADSGQPVRILLGHQYAVRAIAITPDGQTLISASADQTLKFWNLQTGQLRQTITLPESDGIPQTVLISPNGERLATTTNRNTVQLWEVSTGRLIRTVLDEAIDLRADLPVAFSPNSQTLATPDVDHSVKLWNATTGARVITLKGHTEAVRGLAFSPDGQLLASTDQTTAYVWNTQTHQLAYRPSLIPAAGDTETLFNPATVAFSPDGQVFAVNTLLPSETASPFPRLGVTLWDATTGQKLTDIPQVVEFHFSPDGQFLMALGQKVQFWEPHPPAASVR